MSMNLLLIALFLWFLTGFVITLFFGEAITAWIRKFNRRYGEKYAHYMRQRGKPEEPEKWAKWFLRAQLAALGIGLVFFQNLTFALWSLGFVLFAMYYVSKLLHKRELERFDNQMVDITYAMKNSLKAGMTLQQAMTLIATEFTSPASDEFRVALGEIQLGASIEESLKHMDERLNNPDFKIMVNAIEILRQTGGNMVETFENITETLKSRKRVEGKIKTLTAQGRMQAIILCAMPFVMAAMLYFLNRPYIEPLFTTILGNVLLTIVLLMVSSGWVIINKIIAIEV